MGRVVRLTENELVGLLSSLAKMFIKKDGKSDTEEPSTSNEPETGDESEKSDDNSSSSKPIGKVSAKGQELLNNPIFKGSAANE